MANIASALRAELAFTPNTTIRNLKDGRCRIKCKRGLWAVEGPDEASVMSEARRYFFQYYLDGEYDD
jgi:hypothetical protein